MNTVAAFLLLILGLVGTPSLSQEKQVYQIAMDATFPPMEFLTEDQGMAGFDVELVQELARRAGVQVKLVNVAWDGIFEGLDQRKYDAVASAVTITPERLMKLDFSQPYLESGMVLAVKKEAPLKKPADLKGKKVGAMNFQSPQEVAGAVPGAQALFFDDEELFDTALDQGQVDALYLDFMMFAHGQSLSKTPWRMLGGKLTREPVGLVFPKGDESLKPRFDQALESMKKDGSLDLLLKKWGLGDKN